MYFELTDVLTDAIISAMENQDVEYVVSAVDSQLVISDSDGHIPDEDKFYSLPEWGSTEGFKIREDFVNNLHSPVAKDKLQESLHSLL